MTLVEKLRDALSDLQDDLANIEEVLDKMDSEETAYREVEVGAPTHLCEDSSFKVAQALGIPEWKVCEDFDAALAQLCEKVTKEEEP